MDEIQLCAVSKTYNPGLFKKKVNAVKDLSLEIASGEVFGLIGPNGAGKSTTIRMLLGLIRPDSGSILFRGKALTEQDIRSEIGYLPENPYLYDHLNLRELLRFCGRSSQLSVEQIVHRSQELLAKLDLLEAQKRPLRTFSKGMLQRAGICFALLHDPSIVIFDEPMSGLDPIGRKMVFDLVMELKQQGKTIFFCSHILSDVERLCDRICLISKGRLIKQFHRDDFLQSMSQAVFLEVTDIPEQHREKPLAMGVQIRQEGQGCLLAVPGENYFSVSAYLQEVGIEILGCRAEWVSLEDLFMQHVKEQEQ
ncbi:MAG: ABC transporter ATP-binding protein [Desulfuromonadales bacterium]|nr:ABC transporter ATP-binding protein [Desulfuromonadales bacterium]